MRVPASNNPKKALLEKKVKRGEGLQKMMQISQQKSPNKNYPNWKDA
jgi:hypothetical protein